MSHVYPFAAVIAEGTETAKRVATLPYDVMNRAEAKAMAGNNSDSFLRVTRSEIELDASVDPYSAEVYARAAANWQHLKQQVLSQDKTPSYYVYSLTMNGRRQTGIVAAASVDDYDQNIIRKHEKTRKEKEDDRTRHITALRAQTGPVFLTYKDSKSIDDIVAATMAEDPLFAFTAEDGIGHTGWRVPASYTVKLQEAFESVPLLYIADGHHRAASASRTRQALLQSGNVGDADKFLSVIFPAGQLKILAYNRLVFDLNGNTPQQFLDKLAAICPVTPDAKAEPDTPATVSMYIGKRWYTLDFRKYFQPEKFIESLDVSLLQDLVLAPILNIEDPRTSKRIDFVGGIRGTAELEKRVDSGEGAVAFSMYPTSLQQLMDIADNNQIMPPKSTWFEPKLRDGLFVKEI